MRYCSIRPLAVLFLMMFVQLVSCGSDPGKHVLSPELQSYMDKGNSYMKAGNYFEAEKMFSEVIAGDSLAIEALYNRGMVYLSTGRPKLAVQDYSRILLTDSTNADVYNSMGLAFNDLGMNDYAIVDYNKAIELDNNFSIAYLNRGITYIDMRRFDMASADLNKAESLDPGNPSIAYQKGILLYKTSDYGNSLKEFNKATAKGFSHPLLFQLRGNCYFRLGMMEKAVGDYTASLNLAPGNAEVVNNRAVAWDKLGNKEKAEADRKLLQQINDMKKPEVLVPIEKLEFATYTAPNKEFTIELPKGWHVVTNVNENETTISISKEKITYIDDYLHVGARLSLNKNVIKQSGTSDMGQILGMFENSLMLNFNSYNQYFLEMKKTAKSGDYAGSYNKSRFQITSDDPVSQSYELMLSKHDRIFFGYFTSPAEQFGYYSQIFERAMKSLKINN